MISADLITDNSSSTSSIRTGENICLYPKTTSMAVSTSSAAQTQKYCPLVSCVAVSCIVRILCVLCGEPFVAVLRNFRRHQIHQRENEHPHQIDKVPVQPADFNVVR